MKKIFILLFVLVFGSCAFALDYSVYKLDDGQTVIIKQVKNNPIVTIDTWLKTGSINEDDQNSGVSHFLEHLFFKGTKNHPPGDFDKILESKGAVTNAATSKDFTHYYVTIPSKDFDLAIDLHADMILNPLVPRKELEKERKVVLEEIAKDANDPDEKVYDNLNDMLYVTHPYKRKVLGKGEIIEKITRDEILDYYNKFYTPSNMVTIIIGNVDPDHALAKVQEDFASAAGRKTVIKAHQCEKPLTAKQLKIDYVPAQSGYLLIGYRGVNALDPDTYALDLLSTILGQGRSSLLYQAIKEQKQLAFSVSASNSSFREDGLFVISANFTPDNSDKLQKAIFDEVARIQRQGVTLDELNRAKNVIERDTYYSRESISNISSEIGYSTVLTDNPKYYDEYIGNIKKVSLSDIKKVANQYLQENISAVSIVLPEESKPQQVSAKPPVEHPFTLVSEIPSTKKFALDNGATMLVSQNDLNDIVAMSIYVKGGEFLEKVPASAYLTSAVMLKGTAKYSSLELAELLEENGIKISPSSSADSFSIDVLTTKDQLAKTFELLGEIVNNAKFDDYEIEKTRTAKLNSIKQSRDVPMNIALDEYRTLIFENSVYSNGASKIMEKNLPKVQREDIMGYYNTIFNPKNIVISINGCVDEKYMANQLSEIFPPKNAEKFNYNSVIGRIPTLTTPKKSVKKIKDLKTAWVIFGWQTSGVQNEKDYATLQVIDSILGSGMSSRLFRNVRDQEGLAYQLGSSFSPKAVKGSFILYIGTNPKTLTLASEKMLAEVNRLKVQFVSDKELQEAKDKLIGNYVISLETNLEKASTVGWFEASQRGYEFKDKYEKLINSVSASDIIEVANKYFTANYVTSIVQGE